MSTAAFKRAVETALLQEAFSKVGKAWRFDGEGVTIIIGLQKIEYSAQTFVNVGFWLKALGDTPPEKVELTHMYYRLERLCPMQREAILTAGDENAGAHEHWMAELGPVLVRECLPRLKALASFEALRADFRSGKLSGGLVRKEVRQLLEAG